MGTEENMKTSGLLYYTSAGNYTQDINSEYIKTKLNNNTYESLEVITERISCPTNKS